jgi:amidase
VQDWMLYFVSRFSRHGHQLISLGPTTPYASIKHGDFTYVAYTGVFNVLDYSACSFPTGLTVDAKTDVATHDGEPLNSFDSDVRTKCKNRSVTCKLRP